MESIRLLIVDDHRLFRQGLASLLRSEPGFEVLGEASSASEALRLLQEIQPDVILLDLAIPGVTGTELIDKVRACRPATPVLVLTASDANADLIAAVRAGANGYVLKNADADTLFGAIQKVYAGRSAVCDSAMDRMLEILRGVPVRPAVDALLTPREQEVLALVTDGCDNGQIAARLVISENTVKTHVSHILEKLGMHSRAELIKAAHARPLR